MDASIFKLVSIGRVTENKDRTSRKVNVLPVEQATATDGELNFNPLEEVMQGFDSEGNQYSVKAITTRDIECEWLPNEDNRVTPPDVVRNELVEIWRMGDTDQYYWRCLGLRNNLRMLESVVFAWNASTDLAGAGIDFSKCYFMAISAHDKHFTIGTSKANGEPFEYRFQINTKEGGVYIFDDIKNIIELNSKEKQIQLINADQSYVNVEKKFIHLKADQEIKFTVGGSTYTMQPSSIASNTQQYSNKNSTYNVDCAGMYTAKTGNVNWTTGSFAVI